MIDDRRSSREWYIVPFCHECNCVNSRIAIPLVRDAILVHVRTGHLYYIH